MANDMSAFQREREAALVRVQAPAILLIITGLLNLGAAIYMVLGAYSVTRVPRAELEAQVRLAFERFEPEERQQILGGRTIEQVAQLYIDWAPFVMGLGAVMALFGLLSVLGGIRMRQLRSYGLAVTGAVLMAIPGLSPLGCCLVGEVVGIWSLVVLFSGDVSRAFAAAPLNLEINDGDGWSERR